MRLPNLFSVRSRRSESTRANTRISLKRTRICSDTSRASTIAEGCIPTWIQKPRGIRNEPGVRLTLSVKPGQPQTFRIFSGDVLVPSATGSESAHIARRQSRTNVDQGSTQARSSAAFFRRRSPWNLLGSAVTATDPLAVLLHSPDPRALVSSFALLEGLTLAGGCSRNRSGYGQDRQNSKNSSD